jgi:hypothetical protein
MAYHNLSTWRLTRYTPSAVAALFNVLAARHTRHWHLALLALVACGVLSSAFINQTHFAQPLRARTPQVWLAARQLLAAAPANHTAVPRSPAALFSPLGEPVVAVAPLATCAWLGGSGDWNDQSKWSCGMVPGPADIAVINSGTVTVSTPVAVGILELHGGTINGSDELTVISLTNWSSGTMSGNGSTKIAAGAVLNLNGPTGWTLNGRTLNNAGTTFLKGPGVLALIGAIINNLAGATFDVQSNGDISSSGPSTFNNAGRFLKSGGSGTTEVMLSWTDSGETEVQTGTLKLNGGATVSGPIAISSGATLEIASDVTFAAGASLPAGPSPSPNCLIALSSGKMDVQTILTTSCIYSQTGGALAGPANITFIGLMFWSGGEMKDGGMTICAGGGGIESNTPKYLSGRVLRYINPQNQPFPPIQDTSAFATCPRAEPAEGTPETAQQSCTPSLILRDGATIINQATYILQGNGGIGSAGTGSNTFINEGTFERSSNTGPVSLGVAFNNSGQVQALSGTTHFNGQFRQTAGATSLNGGNLGFGVTGQLQGGALNGAGNITGNLNNSGATVSPGQSPGLQMLSGNYAQGPGGTLNLELGGLTPGTQYDRLAVGGTATLAGTLNVSLINGFVPSLGNAFQILTFAARAGDFAVKNGLNLGGGLHLTPSFNPTDLALTAVTCGATLSRAGQSFAANGGAGSINVTIDAGCNWTAVSNDPNFITVTAPVGSVTGSGMVSYNVANNPGASTRSGTITVAGQLFTVRQGRDFLDVPQTHPFYNEIGRLAAHGITLGCGSDNYCPEAGVTREQMAIFIERALGAFTPPPGPATPSFADVPNSGATDASYEFIEDFFARGVTSGCAAGPPRLYCPTANVTREQMAIFILRALGVFTPPPGPAMPTFADVPNSGATDASYEFIEEFFARGITQGCAAGPPRLYCPTAPVTRAQMAVFLVRAFNL